jgi:TRAP-type C4-dicarboxylate transport system substrate-binding protein
MSPLLRTLACAAALALSALAPASAAAKDLKIATVAPEGTPWFDALTAFDKDLRERTSGQLGWKIYPSGMQGDEKVVLKKMKAGQLQAAAFTGMGIGEVLPWVRLLELPFQYRSGEEVDHVRALLDARLRAELEKRGYVLVGWSEVGTATLFSNRRLSGVDDVRASKPWLWEGDPLAGATYRGFGVNPTPLALPDVLTSLQTGLIDTVYSAPTACIGLQWYTKLKYRIDVPLTIAAGGTLVSKAVFDKLPEDQRKALLELGAAHGKKLIEQSRKDDEEGKKVLAEKGIETITWEPREVARNEEIGRKVSEELAGEGEGKLFPKPLLDEVFAALAAFREKSSGAGGK